MTFSPFTTTRAAKTYFFISHILLEFNLNYPDNSILYEESIEVFIDIIYKTIPIYYEQASEFDIYERTALVCYVLKNHECENSKNIPFLDDIMRICNEKIAKMEKEQNRTVENLEILKTDFTRIVNLMKNSRKFHSGTEIVCIQCVDFINRERTTVFNDIPFDKKT